MNILGYLVVALASIFLANAIPHLTRGAAGYRHQVPWAKPASPATNVVWASLNLLLGVWLAYWASTFGLFLPVALTVGIVVGGALLAFLGSRWEKDPAAQGRPAE